EGGPADAVQRDQSDGGTYSDVPGVRERELERIGAVPASRGLSRHVLRMAEAETKRRSGVVQGPLARAAAVRADDGCSDCREDHRSAAAVSLSGSPQASGGA